MLNNELKSKLANAETLEEVEALLKGEPNLDPKKVYEELRRHRSEEAEKLDLDELDAVSGGAVRDWAKDGCAATCEEGSWCWSNDRCQFWDVTYCNFWKRCPDGHHHEYDGNSVCVRCGHIKGYAGWEDN